MRWIPAGSFLMGSPEGEPGRFEWEGPQHEVTLTEGFWLADTPGAPQLLVSRGLPEEPQFIRLFAAAGGGAPVDGLPI